MPHSPTHNRDARTTAPLPAMPAWLTFGLVALLLIGCSGRDTFDRRDVEVDTEDATADNGGDTSVEDVEHDTISDDDTGVEDTRMPDTSKPEDTDPGPRELLNGTPVRFGHVIDGDTFDVFVGDEAVKVYTVRLKGLAAPECFKQEVRTELFGDRFQCVSDDELHGLAAWEALRDYLDGAEGYLTCDDVAVGEWCPTDNYDRYLAYVEIDGRDVATEMAFQGHAFSYTSFRASKRAEICAAEYDAQDANRGIWNGRTVDEVLAGMHTQTQNWYRDHHDWRCDQALGQ